MQLLYNSDAFAVMRFADPAEPEQPPASSNASGPMPVPGNKGGFEVVDKMSRKEIYLQGAVAESFHRGVMALVDQGPDPQALDDFIAGYTAMAQQPVVLH
jgi:hypothetical protein